MLVEIYMRGASFSIGNNEPYLALMQIQAANAVLPPPVEDPETGEVIENSGYSVDLSDIIPKVTQRNDNAAMYMSEDLSQDQDQWVTVNLALQRVTRAISRYAHDKKDEFGMN